MGKRIAAKKERNEKIKELKRRGYTDKELAKLYDLSPARISTLCGGMSNDARGRFQSRVYDECIYPNLKNYLIKNKVSLTALANMMYDNSYNMITLKNLLRGNGIWKKPTIDRLLKATGLTYEVAFAEEEKGE